MNEHFAIVTHEVDPYTESKSRKRGIQMSETEPVVPSTLTPSLRREALLPNERNRGLGTVAVVCTMAGVASGLALATTLMAMQVADSMAPRQCPYHLQHVKAFSETRYDHGFLGIRYFFKDGVAEIDSVLPNTPAERIRLHKGDHVIRVNGAPIGVRQADDRLPVDVAPHAIQVVEAVVLLVDHDNVLEVAQRPLLWAISGRDGRGHRE